MDDSSTVVEGVLHDSMKIDRCSLLMRRGTTILRVMTGHLKCAADFRTLQHQAIKALYERSGVEQKVIALIVDCAKI